MASKISLIFVCCFIIIQLLFSEATIVRRDAPAVAEPPKKNDLEEALNSFKQGFEELVQKIQNNELVQNASKAIDEFGQKVKLQGEELVQKIKDSSTSKSSN